MNAMDFMMLMVLGAMSVSLHSDGVVVVAADSVGEAVRVDLGAPATLSCPGASTFPPTSLILVSWFVGNQTADPLQQTASLSVAGRQLVFQSTTRESGGWYSCQYHNAGVMVRGRVQLKVVDLYINMHVLTIGQSSPSTQTGVQDTVQSVPPNRMVILHAGTTEGDDLTQRDILWLYQGGNTDIKRPFFCYSGIVTSQNMAELRMVLLASYHNYSGVYEVRSGQLRASLNLTVRDDGTPAMLPSAFQETYANCDDTYQPKLVTPPTATAPTTTAAPISTASATHAPTAASVTNVVASPVVPDTLQGTDSRSTQTISPSMTRDDASSSPSESSPPYVLQVVRDNPAWLPGVAGGAGGLLIVCFVILLWIVKQRRSANVNGKNRDVESRFSAPPPPRTVANNQTSMPSIGKVSPPSLLSSAGEEYSLPQAVLMFHSVSSEDATTSPGHIQNDTRAFDHRSCHSMDGCADSLDRFSIQTDMQSTYRAASEATMLSAVTMQDSDEPNSLTERYLQIQSSSHNGGSQSSPYFLRPESASIPQGSNDFNPALSCPTKRRHDSLTFASSSSSLLPRFSNSPSPSNANIVVSADGSSPALNAKMAHHSRASSMSRSYNQSPLAQSSPRSERHGSISRSSANIVRPDSGRQRTNSLRLAPSCRQDENLSHMVESYA